VVGGGRDVAGGWSPDFSLPIKSPAGIFSRSLLAQRADFSVSSRQNRAGPGSRHMDQDQDYEQE
jgi:hypothetical protein